MKKKVVKADIAETLREMCGGRIRKEEAARIVERTFDKIKAELADGNTIELRGFGSFLPKMRAGRKEARNPKTGELTSVPPHYVAVFKPGQDLKAAMKAIPADSESSSE